MVRTFGLLVAAVLLAVVALSPAPAVVLVAPFVFGVVVLVVSLLAHRIERAVLVGAGVYAVERLLRGPREGRSDEEGSP